MKHCKAPECNNEIEKGKFCSQECFQNYRKYYKPKKSLRKDVWKLMSEWVRRKDAGFNGMTRCYTCGNPVHWKEANAGHWKHGVSSASYLEEDNVRVQCVACNQHRGGKLEEYTLKLLDEIGRERMERIRKLKHQTYSKDEIREKIKYYQKKVDNLNKDIDL